MLEGEPNMASRFLKRRGLAFACLCVLAISLNGPSPIAGSAEDARLQEKSGGAAPGITEGQDKATPPELPGDAYEPNAALAATKDPFLQTLFTFPKLAHYLWAHQERLPQEMQNKLGNYFVKK